MAKGKNQPSGGHDDVVVNSDDETVVLNTSVSKGLLKRIQAFQKASGMSTEQEAIRVGMNLFLTKNGF